MITINDLKQKYIEYLYDMELSRLSVLELQTYGNALRVADEISKPSYAESMTALFSQINAMKGCACKAEDRAVELDG